MMLTPRLFPLTSLLALYLLQTIASAADRPNIVFIYTDDQAPTAVGFSGNTELKTPNIDRIANEGIVIKNAFTVTPVCSPARAALATSRYACELEILDWINPKKEPELGLNPNTITWMELLQKAGYRTSLSGKWHLGTADRYHPTLQGFDDFMGIRSGGCPPKDPVLEVNGHDTKMSGFTVDLVTENALKFIRENQKKPFLASIHYREPHAAWLPTRDEDWEPYQDLDPSLPQPVHPDLNVELVKKRIREYYASVASVDRNVGRVLDLLDELKLADNTVVVFTSDHGYHYGHHALWYKGNAQWMLNTLPEQTWPHIAPKQRPNMYDQALKVPAAIRWPAGLKGGRTVPQTMSNLDWYPTLLAMVNVEIPDDLEIRGRDFTPMLKGLRIAWDNSLYSEYSMRHGAKTDMRCWRTPQWKLMIDFANPGRGELYDLNNDPNELTNLFDSEEPQHVAIRDSFKSKILKKIKQINDPLQLEIESLN
ncbi:sulfatase family protein [Thalassoglobus polymorphus]|uniref:Arylsulfatase n=1 Tax=Thalassoglobus polymorphus TaxID=2527994 RepID=A0A517QVM0_9PLAN|nr:sulfatase-like hydrolase/transferase [Thalassoglobus polymorphus]QDT35624.1 Arylsulfatase [Thalassoglobus polymorphus]